MTKQHRTSNASFVFLAMIMLFAATSAFAADIKVLVNGEEVQFDRLPEEQDGAILVPFRFVAEKLGAIVAWDGCIHNADRKQECFHKR